MPVRLVPLAREHLPALVPLFSDPEQVRYTHLPIPMPDGFPEDFLARYEAGREQGLREVWALVEEGGAVVGFGCAPVIDRRTGEVELGYAVESAFQRRGYATGALRLMTDWAFDEIGAERVLLVTSLENVPSHKVAERCGYVREGVQRSVWLREGEREDAVTWSRIRADHEGRIRPASSDAVVVRPGGGVRVGNVEFLATTDHTPRFNSALIEIQPGRRLEAHAHRGEDDSFYILEGVMTFEVDGRDVVAPPGTWIMVPPGVMHGFRNDGDVPVRMFNVHAPAGFDRRIAS